MAKPSEGKSKGANKRRAPSQEASPPKRAKLGKDKQAPKPLPANLSRKEKKELVREKKAKRQKNFGLIQEVVGLWEELRRHDVSADKRTKLISAVLRKVQGRVAELAASHTASRVIQACVKHGTAQERAAILKEVEPKLLDLSKSPYGHFVVSKLISLAPKEQLPGILKAFRGQVPALLRHPAGAHVIDDLWAVADSRQRNAMAAEFYGREYSLLEGGTINGVAGGAPSHLPDLLAAVDGAKRRAVIQHLAREVVPVVEKGLVDPPLVHRLVAEFLECSPASLVADAVESLCGEPLLHMVHTKEGARAACMALAYATAKERKKAVRAFKGHVATMARDEWGHLVLITALSVVDDTALLKKFIVGELQKELQDLCSHHYGHRVLLQLLHPYCPRYLPPQLLAIVRPPQKVYTPVGGGAGGEVGEQQEEEGGAAGKAGTAAGKKGQQQGAAEGRAESDDEDDGEGGGGSRPASGPLGVSKKDDSTRRRELFGAGASGLGGALAGLCASHADELLRSQYGCDVVVEACRGGEGGLLEECAGEAAVTAVHRAVAAAVASSSQGPQGQQQQQQLAGGSQEGDGENGAAEGEGGGSRGGKQAQQEPLLEHYFASRALRRLVLSSAPQAGQSGVDAVQAPATRCVELLWAQGGLRGHCKRWVGGHAAKVLAALVRCGSGAVRVAAAEELAPLVAPQGVEEWAERFAAARQGAAADGGGGKQGGKRKRKGGAQQPPHQQQQQQQGEEKRQPQQVEKQQQAGHQKGNQQQPQKQPQQAPAKQAAKRQKKAN